MNQLGILAKYWEPGQVKTRLAAAIGHARASQLHQAFLTCLLRRFRQAGDQRVLWFTPHDRAAEFAALAGGDWQLRPQAGGDLGDRLRQCFEVGFSSGARRVVLLGADAPTLPEEFLRQAFDVLTDRRVVLGPARDGGYYLVGAAERPPPIFESISWSTSQVWRQTVEQLHAAGSSYGVLPLWYDIDEASDLEILQRELAAGANDPELQSLSVQLAAVLKSFDR